MPASSIILAILAFWAALSVIGDSSPQKIILDHADTLRSRGESRELIGNVRVRRGATTIKAARALYQPEMGRITLTGGVKMTDPDRSVDAEVIHYNERTGDFDASGEVLMTAGDSLKIRCRTAKFTDFNKTAELEGGVIIDILRDGSRITGGYGRFITADSSGVIEKFPVYSLPDAEGEPPDTLVISSHKLEFSRRDKTALFTGEVKMVKGEAFAVADSLFHQPDSGKSHLTGAPIVWRGKDELSGTSIEMVYRGRELKRIFVFGDAVALTPAHDDDPRRNRLTGESLTLDVPTDSTRTVTAIGSAVGWYYVWDVKEGYKGVNIAAADRIRLDILYDKTTGIQLDGKTSGAFHPPGQEPLELQQNTAPRMDGIGWGEQ